ncbi:MAG: hypothetical protein NZM33_14815 [Bryobacteraceae bacterium]|nr:hypothetical protein [Bryobacteraceae bacterium]
MARPAEYGFVGRKALRSDDHADQARLSRDGEHHEGHAAVGPGVGVRSGDVGGEGNARFLAKFRGTQHDGFFGLGRIAAVWPAKEGLKHVLVARGPAVKRSRVNEIGEPLDGGMHADSDGWLSL